MEDDEKERGDERPGKKCHLQDGKADAGVLLLPTGRETAGMPVSRSPRPVAHGAKQPRRWPGSRAKRVNTRLSALPATSETPCLFPTGKAAVRRRNPPFEGRLSPIDDILSHTGARPPVRYPKRGAPQQTPDQGIMIGQLVGRGYHTKKDKEDKQEEARILPVEGLHQ